MPGLNPVWGVDVRRAGGSEKAGVGSPLSKRVTGGGYGRGARLRSYALSGLKKRPIQDAASFLAADELAEDLRVKHPLVETDSVDVVVSNCVLNLVESGQKRRLFEEISRVLKLGGRAVISDIVSDEEVPDDMQRDPILWAAASAVP